MNGGMMTNSHVSAAVSSLSRVIPGEELTHRGALR
jgi:hypothetical protein